MKKTAVIAILLMFTVLHSVRIWAEPTIPTDSIDEGARPGYLLVSMHNFINDAIDEAQNTGHYLLFKSATELKSMLDTWEKANPRLIDKTFQELDKAQLKFFNSANIAAKKLNQDAAAQKEAATMIAGLANQIVADAGIFDGKLALFSYSPRIAYPGMRKSVSLIIRGINFDKANPRITLPNGKSASRVSLSKQEAVFSVPTSVFKFETSKAGFARLKLSYLTSKKKRESTDMAVLQLPKTIGDFALQIRARDTVRDIWEGTRQFYWSGRHESKIQSQGPHDSGWKMITSSLRQGRAWGEAGKGCFIVSNDEQGFAIELRVGAVSTDLDQEALGYQYCEWHWKEYFERQVINEQPPISGQINWSKDITLSFPVNTVSLILRVKTWGGIERAITGSHEEPFYRVVDKGDFLVIKPQIPADLNEF